MEINKILELMEENISLTNISKDLNLPKEKLISILVNNKYYYAETPRAHSITILKLKNAAEYFITHTESYSKVERDFGLKKCSLKLYLEKYYSDVEINKKYCDESVFDNIDTEEKAYWLGFIFADGYINSKPLEGTKSYSFELTLSYKDIDHLRKFAKFIKFSKDLYIKDVKYNDKVYRAARVSIYSKHLWEVLNSYGCTPRKSLTLKFPDKNIFKESSLIRHFIRGYFDGDGTLGIYTDTHSYSKCLLGMLGTVDMLSSIRDFFILEKEIVSAASEAHPNNAFKIVYASREALCTAFCMYYNSTIYLHRKYEIFMNFCRSYKELYEVLSSKIGEGCDVNPEVILKIAKGFKTL